jgi:hypothetical protein
MHEERLIIFQNCGKSRNLSKTPSFEGLSCVFVVRAIFEFALLYLISSSFYQHEHGSLRRSEPISDREWLSPKSVPLLIIVVGVSQVYLLKQFVTGHDDMDCHLHQLTVDDLTSPTCNFSCDDHSGRDAFLLPDILTWFNVSNGQIPY